ncbi:MAG: redoxin domain-containing protein, partial [Gammaproteobacteria bacterium]|nr:redoxin domain-containing protein [Gammaproteobacteria bacterium]
MRRLSVLFALLLASAAVSALTPNDHVDNFRLFDHAGQSHELYYLSDAKAVVFMVQGNGCPIVRNALPRLKEIRDTFESQGVEFRMINANLQDNRESIAKEAEEFGMDIPILIDDTQIIGESLGLVRTGEVFVL